MEKEEILEYVITMKNGNDFITDNKSIADDEFSRLQEENRLNEVEQYYTKTYVWNDELEDYVEDYVEVYYWKNEEEKEVELKKGFALDDEILHMRFKNEDELGEYIAKVLNVDTKIKLVLDDTTDFEDEKTDYDYVGEVRNAGELLADVYVWVLYDRQKQLYVTEIEIESI